MGHVVMLFLISGAVVIILTAQSIYSYANNMSAIVKNMKLTLLLMMTD